MFHFYACLRLRFSSKVFTTKFVPIAILSLAIFLVIAVIACTAAKAFEDQTWAAFAILIVVSCQVLLFFLVSRYAVLANTFPALEKSVPGLVVFLRTIGVVRVQSKHCSMPFDKW